MPGAFGRYRGGMSDSDAATVATVDAPADAAAPGPPGPIVTRFAPSPTGYLHVGGARTALFNWLLARHAGGRFLLRIEDTDLARSTDAATAAVLDDLRWLGLHHDNDVLVFQSKRVATYDAIIDGLLSRGLAYRAYETPEELDNQRRQAERARRPYVYRRPTLTDEQVRQYEGEGRPAVVRFAMPRRAWSFRDDVLQKVVETDEHQAQDFVIRKADGMPTYHFAVVVDDAAMGVTHVLRGQEHLLNTMQHVALQEALGYARPTYGHLPVILNTDGSKMGKRDRDKAIRTQANNVMRSTRQTAADLSAHSGLPESRLAAWLGDAKSQLDPNEQAALMPAVNLVESDLPEIAVHEFRKSGYLPQTLNNFLALLGWSPGEDRERMTMDEMVSLFSMDRIGHSNAKFDRAKLTAFSTEAFNALPAGDQLRAMRDYLEVNPASPLNAATDAQLRDLLAMNKGFHVLRDVDEKSRFFFEGDDAIEYDAKSVEKVLRKNGGEGLDALRQVRATLAECVNWAVPDLEGAIKAKCDELGLGLGKVAQPVRVAVSGSAVSPPIFETLEFLGRERTLARIDRCLALHGG